MMANVLYAAAGAANVTVVDALSRAVCACVGQRNLAAREKREQGDGVRAYA
jgi:hypothetical protein